MGSVAVGVLGPAIVGVPGPAVCPGARFSGNSGFACRSKLDCHRWTSCNGRLSDAHSSIRRCSRKRAVTQRAEERGTRRLWTVLLVPSKNG